MRFWWSGFCVHHLVKLRTCPETFVVQWMSVRRYTTTLQVMWHSCQLACYTEMKNTSCILNSSQASLLCSNLGEHAVQVLQCELP